MCGGIPVIDGPASIVALAVTEAKLRGAFTL